MCDIKKETGHRIKEKIIEVEKCFLEKMWPNIVHEVERKFWLDGYKNSNVLLSRFVVKTIIFENYVEMARYKRKNKEITSIL